MASEISQLKRAVSRLVKAEIAKARISEQPQEHWHLKVEQDLHNARTTYNAKLERLTKIVEAAQTEGYRWVA